MSFFKKALKDLQAIPSGPEGTAMGFMTDAIKKTAKVVEHGRNTLIGGFNPNRRHDEEHEKEQDAKREAIRDGHRFRSFAPERTNNTVKWHIDGHDYMWAISEMIENAKEVVFILDWWLTPELYLRRPPAYFPKYRLDRLLLRKAEQGVKIYIIVYKEVPGPMSMSSKHTKNYLLALHPNIAVMRHPDHIGSKDNVALWSHHEKVVVVDNHFAAIGGLDLCFGRWDTHNHPCADVHPTEFDLTLFPGQDFNNARIMDFQEPKNYASNALSPLDNPRMPWHDVHMTLTGPSVLDIVQHFTERWNEIRKRKYAEDPRFPLLALPHDAEAAPNEPIANHPHYESWGDLGRKYKQRWHGQYSGHEQTSYPQTNNAACRVQVIRSAADWSHGILPLEDSIQQAYLQSIAEAEHYIYIENQFFISNTVEGGDVKNQIAKALADRIIRAAKEGKPFQVVVFIPEVPGFAGDVQTDASVQTIMSHQYMTINRGGNSIYEKIRAAGYEPLNYIRIYHLRTYDRINAPAGFIKSIEENSGVTFNQAHVALARKWVSGDAYTEQKTVIVGKAHLTTDPLAPGQPTPATTEEVPLPESDQAAEEIVSKFEHGADNLRRDAFVSDSVAGHLLRDRTTLAQEKWLGTREEELNAYVSEMLYIHSKLMIVDDRRVIMGSANINDRSQRGDGDSEICLVVEDQDMIDATMGGEPYRVSRFAATLRRKLYREHLGLIEPQECNKPYPKVTTFMRPAPIPNRDETREPEDRLVADPLARETQLLLIETAHRNREVFAEFFRPIPTNLVRTADAYKNYIPKVKQGHVVPGTDLDRLKERLQEVRGAIVECPLDFLIDDKEFNNGHALVEMTGAAGKALFI